MQETESHDIQILLTNGRVVHFTQRELHDLAYSKRVKVFLACSLVVIALANPTLFPSIPEYSARLFYWGVCVILYILVIPYWSLVTNALWRRFLQVPLPLIIATAPLNICLSAISTLIPMLLGDIVPQRGEPLVWTDYLRNLIIGHILETIGLLWLLPLQRSDQQADRAPEDKVRFVILNGRSLPLMSIQLVQSAEHYLIVSASEKATQHRARMKDFLKQVNDGDGVQTHRSHWVSMAQALELRGNVVKTALGVDIPVSRGRRPHVREWFRRHGKLH